ncbi:hypothetical protein YC2023_100354 [Brassica napus]
MGSSILVVLLVPHRSSFIVILRKAIKHSVHERCSHQKKHDQMLLAHHQPVVDGQTSDPKRCCNDRILKRPCYVTLAPDDAGCLSVTLVTQPLAFSMQRLLCFFPEKSDIASLTGRDDHNGMNSEETWTIVSHSDW